MKTAIEKLRDIYDKHGEFPRSWTRYLSLDPGTAKAAVLFGVVPPPDEFGERLIIESEIFARRMPPMALAPEVAGRMAGRTYEAFVIDMHAGKQTTIGSERRVEDQYSDAFAQNGVECNRTGSHFEWGTDDVFARANEVREWLYPAQKGGPRLLFVLENCYQTRREFALYKRKVMQGRATDGSLVTEKPIDKHNDCMHALEYLVSFHPYYVPHVEKKPGPDAGYLEWQARQKAKKAHGRGLVLGPPVPV